MTKSVIQPDTYPQHFRPPIGVISPKTTRQRLIFTTIGVILMVTVMSLFNKALEYGGLTWNMFSQLPMSFLLRAPVAFILQFFIVQKFAGIRTSRYQVENPIEYYAIRVGFTVMVMCPTMSFWSNIIYAGFTKDFVFIWLTKMVLNWGFAFGVQIFLLGPLSRLIFRKIVGNP